MAETFSNFLTNIDSAGKKVQIIIPKADGHAVDGCVGTRSVNAVSQIHSIYITKQQSGKPNMQNIENDGVYVHIYVMDEKSNRYYLGHNIQILPYSSFYIEKTITLLPHQSLYLEYSSDNTVQSKLSCVCSCVDIVE